MTLIPDVFPKLRTPKNMIRSMPKNSCFRASVKKPHAKYPQTLFKFEGEPLYHIFWSLGSQMSYKKSPLGICNISKLFPNTLSDDGIYSLLIETIKCNKFRWNYLNKKKKNFNFLFIFEI